jgi:hypothetical protein
MLLIARLVSTFLLMAGVAAALVASLRVNCHAGVYIHLLCDCAASA